MIRAMYTDLDGSAPRVGYRGVEFVTGVSVEVSDRWTADDAASLQGNPWWTIETDVAPQEPETLPETDLRRSLIAEAEALGIRVDRRWSNETLAAKIDEANG